MSDKEKYGELLEFASELSTELLKLKRYNILLWIYSILGLLPGIFIILLYTGADIADWRKVVIYICIFGVTYFVYILSIFCYKAKYKKLYIQTDRLYNILSDEVDWGILRKKIIYQDVDSRLQKPINDYISFVLSPYCIVERARKFFIFILICGNLYYLVGITRIIWLALQS